MNTSDDEIIRLATGQLSPREAQALQQRAATDPALAQEIAQVKLLWAALPEATKTDTDPRLWASIFEETIAKNPQRSRPEKTDTSRPIIPFWIPACSIALLGICITLFQPQVYQASGRLLLHPREKSMSLSDVALATYNTIELFKAVPVCKAASERMTNGRPLCSYTVSRVENTTLLEITAEGDDPTAVTETVNNVMAAGMHNLEHSLQTRIVEEASVPSAPIRPNKGPNIAFAILLGCVIGGLLQVFRR